MFAKRFTLFRLSGFEVRIDLSWIVIATLVTWSLAKGYFPSEYRGLSDTVYWIMGAVGALGLFASIILHELSHSLIARRFGIPMKGITLFIFGGVAEMDDEPPSAKSEFFMAIAGPLASVILGGIFYVMFVLSYGISIELTGIIGYLTVINWVLAGFNLLPAYPLDGGRVLRSALWHWKKDLRWATKIASQAGSLFGIGMIIMGIVNIMTGVVIGGVWWFIIGLFLRSASSMSYRQVLIRKSLEGEKVRHLMRKSPLTVPSSITIKELVEDFIYKFNYKMFPVVDDGRLIGCISTREVKGIPVEEWYRNKVGNYLLPCSRENTVSPEMDAVNALSIMNQTATSRLMVVESGTLIGIITLKDIMRFLSLRLDLEPPNE